MNHAAVMIDTMLECVIYRSSTILKCSIPNAIKKNNAIINKSSRRRAQSKVSFRVSDKLCQHVSPSSKVSRLRSRQCVALFPNLGICKLDRNTISRKNKVVSMVQSLQIVVSTSFDESQEKRGRR